MTSQESLRRTPTKKGQKYMLRFVNQKSTPTTSYPRCREMMKELKMIPSMKHRSCRLRMKTTAAPPRPRSRSGFTVGHITVFVTALLLFATLHKIEGFASARRTCKAHSEPIVDALKFHKETVIQKSSSSTPIEIPATINSQQSLSRIESQLVKALMVTYIASMCVALPA